MKNQAGMNVGGTSMLAIFVLLCIATFAILTMVSATASYSLARSVVSASDSYYAADAVAEEILAQISLLVRETPSEGLELGLEHLGATISDGIISYSISITESLYLDVRLSLVGQNIEILSWAARPYYDDALFEGGVNVWTGLPN